MEHNDHKVLMEVIHSVDTFVREHRFEFNESNTRLIIELIQNENGAYLQAVDKITGDVRYATSVSKDRIPDLVEWLEYMKGVL